MVTTAIIVFMNSITEIQSELNPLGLIPIGSVEFAIVLQDVQVSGSSAACSNDPRSLTESPLIPGSVRAVEELEQLLKILTQLVQAGTVPGNKQIHICKYNIISLFCFNLVRWSILGSVCLSNNDP